MIFTASGSRSQVVGKRLNWDNLTGKDLDSQTRLSN
jgi:hypothetical protein